LITNPELQNQLEGFIYICVKDKYIPTLIDQIYIPLEPLKPFHPYNFVLAPLPYYLRRSSPVERQNTQPHRSTTSL